MLDRGLPLLTAVPGVKWAKIGRGVESPAKFLILAEWDSLEAHKAFNQSPQSPEFGQLFGLMRKAAPWNIFKCTKAPRKPIEHLSFSSFSVSTSRLGAHCAPVYSGHYKRAWAAC